MSSAQFATVGISQQWALALLEWRDQRGHQSYEFDSRPSAKRQVAPKLPWVSSGQHRLTEIMNQCAHVERLLDALDWAIDCLGAVEVVECHPTQTSGAYDLWAMTPSGDSACFEVADVVGRGDGNSKLYKRARSPTVANVPSPQESLLPPCESGRCYERPIAKATRPRQPTPRLPESPPSGRATAGVRG
jgi:hypothetical protein